MLQTTIHWLTTLPPDTWYHLGEFILTGAGVSVVLQVLKHINNWHGRTGLLQGLTGLFATLVAVAQGYLSALPPGQTVKNGLSLAALATVVYKVSVSPLYGKFMGLVQDAETYRQSVSPQTVTPTGADAVAPPSKFVM